MVGRHPFLVLAIFFCLSWFVLVGFLDRGLLNHNAGGISGLCLGEYLPAGTIHNPEGSPVPPRGEYAFLPLGIECTFTMTDGTHQQSIHPRLTQIILGALPAAAVLAWGVARASASIRRSRAA